MSESLDALGLTATENVYRVNPMDRDTGGKGQTPFGEFVNEEEEEENARKRRQQQEQQREAERLARATEDRLTLSGLARAEETQTDEGETARSITRPYSRTVAKNDQADAREGATNRSPAPRLHLQA